MSSVNSSSKNNQEVKRNKSLASGVALFALIISALSVVLAISTAISASVLSLVISYIAGLVVVINAVILRLEVKPSENYILIRRMKIESSEVSLPRSGNDRKLKNRVLIYLVYVSPYIALITLITGVALGIFSIIRYEPLSMIVAGSVAASAALAKVAYSRLDKERGQKLR